MWLEVIESLIIRLQPHGIKKGKFFCLGEVFWVSVCLVSVYIFEKEKGVVKANAQPTFLYFV